MCVCVCSFIFNTYAWYTCILYNGFVIKMPFVVEFPRSPWRPKLSLLHLTLSLLDVQQARFDVVGGQLW